VVHCALGLHDIQVQGQSLELLLREELTGAVSAPVAALAAHLASFGAEHTAVVLYYGSTLRSGSLNGVLDFYVLLDSPRHWPGSWFARAANVVLPPNVGYLEFAHSGQLLRAKYAVMGLRQFRRRMRASTIDTTLWARFCQPCVCAWQRSTQDIDATVPALAEAVSTAAHWAALLGALQASAADYWRALFARTYDAELRVERVGRAADIVAQHPERYEKLLPLAWSSKQRDYSAHTDGTLKPVRSAAEARAAASRWALRRRLGKPLNILRLLKASLTFAGAMDYIAWKIERHSGVKIEVTAWQRRFPLLAAPGLYWQLRKRGVLR
jgi:hypothetical protein